MLAVCFGAGIGLLSTFVTILEQLLCVHGYSDVSSDFIYYRLNTFSNEALVHSFNCFTVRTG